MLTFLNLFDKLLYAKSPKYTFSGNIMAFGADRIKLLKLTVNTHNYFAGNGKLQIPFTPMINFLNQGKGY